MEKKSYNDDIRICKICNKGFASGKAMGGHMRSHLAKLPLPPKPNSAPHRLKSHPSSSSVYSYTSQNQHQLYSAINTYQHHHPAPVMINGGNTTGSDSPKSGLITRSRSKRTRESSVESVTRVAVQRPERDGSDSEIFSAEEGAWTLISISRAKYNEMEDLVDREGEVDKDSISRSRYNRMDLVDLDNEHEYELDEDEVDEDDDSLVAIKEQTMNQSKIGRYKCETCKKFFRSYQALGGHRSSHKKMKRIVFSEEAVESELEDQGNGSGGGDAAAVGFKCPFCDKVFESGQALGGHKKVHLTYLSTPTSGGDFLNLNCSQDEELSDEEVSIATAIEMAEMAGGQE